jgi:hypothetical protein
MHELNFDWKSEIISYLNKGDGILCPMINHCESRKNGEYCISDNLDNSYGFEDEPAALVKIMDNIKPAKACWAMKLLENMVRDFLNIAGVTNPPVPDNIYIFADTERPIEIRTLPLKYLRGATWHLGNQWTIYLNSNETDVIKRHTLFHEVFHIFTAKHTPASFQHKRRKHIGTFHEFLADAFATRVLVPPDWIHENWPQINDAKTITSICNCRLSSVYCLLRHSGMI